MQVYLDNAATTKPAQEIIRKILSLLNENWANPSSSHKKGEQARQSLEQARKVIANAIHASPEEIYFTSGGTEANNLAFHSILSGTKKKHIITSCIEHASILNLCNYLEKQGYEITYLPVDKQGFISIQALKSALKKSTALVSIMHANNEIGTVQDIKTISRLCQQAKVPFHTDAVQSFKKISISTKGITAISLSAHKVHALKGTGALYLKKGTPLYPLFFGGAQENTLRPGTENTLGISCFAEAVKIKYPFEKVQKLRDYMIKELLKIPGAKLNGSKEKRLCNNMNMHFEGSNAELLMKHLSEKNIFVSTGSACDSQKQQASHVLKAIGLSDKQAQASLRITLSPYTTKREIDYTVRNIKYLVSITEKLQLF
ncbi:cysteine desulfurase [Candidatus Woesearchaeota archaeon]|nr:cysteine desulfurase [Candidatus Woesearchaeota archaeon]